MRNATFIDTEEVNKIYEGKLVGADAMEGGSVGPLNPGISKELEVEVLNYVGPYALVKIVSVYARHAKFIVPTSLLQPKVVEYSIESFKPILDTHHPGKWYYDENDDYLYIAYPELTIKNSLNQEHTIYDLVVKITMDERIGKLYGDTLQGKRFSFTEDEIRVGYSHSHLPGGMESGFRLFCQGGASPFKKFLSSYNRVVTAPDFELFLIQLKEYLSWESIEGNPHIHIASMFETDTSGYSHPVYDNGSDGQTIEKMVKFILKRVIDNPTLLVVCNEVVVFDPAADENLMYSIEKEFVKETEPMDLLHHLIPFDTERRQFIGDPEENFNNPPSDLETNYMHGIAQKLNITKRVIPSPLQKPENPNIEVRLSRNYISEVVRLVNDALLTGLNKLTDAERIQIKEKTDSNYNRETISTDTVSA